jgi:hypothetical protein
MGGKKLVGGFYIVVILVVAPHIGCSYRFQATHWIAAGRVFQHLVGCSAGMIVDKSTAVVEAGRP